MNKGDFYKKINDLYDKGTYLEKYGLQAILAAVIIILVFSAISYLTLRKNESEIVHNWGRGNVKTENGEYLDRQQTGPDYKCDPRYAPLAGFMSGKIQNKTQEETYDAAFAAENFTECVTDTLEDFTLSLFNPFLLIASMTHANLGNFTMSMGGIMDVVPKIRKQVALFIQSVFNKLGMFVSYMRKFIYKISDMYQRGMGIAGITLYIFQVIFFQIIGMAQLIVSVINNWLEAVVVILINILIVAVIALIALVIVIGAGYIIWLAGFALAATFPPWTLPFGILLVIVGAIMWVGSIIASVVVFLVIPITLIALLFYALFILIPVEHLVALFPNYIQPDPGAALALSKGKEKNNKVGLLKYLFPAPPKPGLSKPNKPPSPGETFTGKMAEKLRHCFDKNTILSLNNGKNIEISKIKLGDILKDGGVVTAIYKAKYDKQHEIYSLKETLVTGEHLVLYNNNYIAVKNHPESIRINKYNKKHIYCVSTSNKTIKINETIFSDWDELTNEEIHRLNVVDIHKELEGGFSGDTKIKLNNQEVSIENIKLGDKLSTGETVLGIMQIDSKNTNCFEYNIKGNKIVGGPNIMYQNESLGINSTKNEINKRRVDINTPLYHIITDTTMVPIGNTLFFDYQSCLDNLL